MNLQPATQTFLHEADDLLVRIEETALEIEDSQNAADAVNQLFRAFHTIKGSGAMFGFEAIARFTHHVETALDQAREGRLEVSEDLVRLILASKDHIGSLLEAARNGSPEPTQGGEALIAELKGLLTSANGLPTQQPTSPAPSAPPNPGLAGTAPAETFQISFRPDPSLMVSGTNPISLLDELRGLGDCLVAANLTAVPGLEKLQPDQCYFSWEITLATAKSANAIKDVFIFVEDGSEISITPKNSEIANASAAPEPSSQSIAAPNPERASEPKPQLETKPTAAAGPAVPSAAALPHPGGTAPKKSMVRDATVRVPAERLDRLVGLVGELVMNQSRLMQVAAAANLPNLNGPAEELARLVDELRDNVLGIRMMPIGPTFTRFKRLVYDLSAELGKEIDLMAEGGDTELDKTVLDQLGDPLVHIIRNSIDHGIELPEERERQGKPRRGTIRLSAAHIGSNVVITISDDGPGIDTEAVRAKAIEKQLIAPDAKLSQREVLDLIFLPGFSTAKRVTNVSGRGVGMDVVKRQFDALRGQVAIASHAGRGTTLTLTLPLTLAIIDGLLVEIGKDQFIVPMAVVTETVELNRAERHRNNGRNVIAVRGELVPYLRLRETFGVEDAELDTEKIVIVRYGDDRLGLVVDRVLGNHQTVIQSLGKFYRNITLVSGTTIMGDGRVALILDLGGLVHAAARNEHNTEPALPEIRTERSRSAAPRTSAVTLSQPSLN